uniref:Uncharacterized protein n=1 Tax=Chromera velia CCMP2878 TaxID=1169474 RepID=A0A0G4HLD0_9ALVE|eukprot:Cvel_28707.t1-p1 / transcript=Cvel_28707.t1 / gene=Cvel_28707 / organism=Chromera_velia_CCMP2878 / gene_product=hypothetical protein / transcript_product=hypothetical protein / location=Cvel_scaffold3809:12774-13160(+) / protein_length=129 / sequence_SO=supercontig / SO=protein_coding / is_pseudo=false
MEALSRLSGSLLSDTGQGDLRSAGEFLEGIIDSFLSLQETLVRDSQQEDRETPILPLTLGTCRLAPKVCTVCKKETSRDGYGTADDRKLPRVIQVPTPDTPQNAGLVDQIKKAWSPREDDEGSFCDNCR